MAIVKKYNEILNAELIAEEYYQKIASYNYESKKILELENSGISNQIHRRAEKYTQVNFQSYRLNLYSYLTFALRYQIVNDL